MCRAGRSGSTSAVVLLIASRVLLALACVASLLVVTPALAESRIDRLGEKLRSAKDFRVRTQAALALGASRSAAAVQHLCAGLSDSSRTVRGAAASALGRLQKGGKKCLQKRLAVEKSSWVQRSLKRALSKISGGGGIVIPDGARFLIAIGAAKDKSGRDLSREVGQAMRTALTGASGVAVAPLGSTAKQAEKALEGTRGVAGFYLLPKVYKAKYRGDTLKVKVKLTVFRLPGKILKGSLKKRLAMSGVASESAEQERKLLVMAAERVAKQFAANASRFE